uniref:Uncharacterized protein n=1 Tax=Arundo donax TaxID=35708 RepID=A0A0A9B331_ARUDO
MVYSANANNTSHLRTLVLVRIKSSKALPT